MHVSAQQALYHPVTVVARCKKERRAALLQRPSAHFKLSYGS
jgi:hypothetical protein